MGLERGHIIGSEIWEQALHSSSLIHSVIGMDEVFRLHRGLNLPTKKMMRISLLDRACLGVAKALLHPKLSFIEVDEVDDG